MSNIQYQLTENAFCYQLNKRKVFNYEKLNKISQPCDTLEQAYNLINEWVNDLLFEMSLEPTYIFTGAEQKSRKHLIIYFNYTDDNNNKCRLKVLFRIKLYSRH